MTLRIDSLAGDFSKFPDIQKKLLQVAEEARGAGVPETLEEITRTSRQTALAEALPSRLKPILFKIEIPTVSEAVYAETRKAVEATGVFIAPIRSVSI